jgi:transcriptional regulator with XRE-family HTH domain
MEAAGINQTTLAAKLGKSRQYIAKILGEKNRANFTIDSLAEISVALGVQLHTRLIPADDRMIFIGRSVTVPTTVSPTPAFPSAETATAAADADEFDSRNGFTFPTSHDRAELPA